MEPGIDPCNLTKSCLTVANPVQFSQSQSNSVLYQSNPVENIPTQSSLVELGFNSV